MTKVGRLLYLVIDLILGTQRHPFLLEVVRELVGNGCHTPHSVQIREPRQVAL